MVRIRRAYDPPSPEDGYRVLVDRLWPRGLRKEALPLDLWAKDLAPSAGLRTWFRHDPARFAEFTRRYRAELRAAPARPLLVDLARRAAAGPVTLVYGARDVEHNGAVVLREVLGRMAPSSLTPPARRSGTPSSGSGAGTRSRRR